MTRTETLLKLLALGGLTYVSIVETTGWTASDVHETVRQLKADQSIFLKHRTRQGLVPIYEINPDKPEPKEAPKVQPMPSSEGDKRTLEPVQPNVHVLRRSVHPAAEKPADSQVGEIAAVLCSSCGMDAIRGRRGQDSGTCRHKNTCDSAVNPTKALEAAWFGDLKSFLYKNDLSQ